MVTVLFFHVWLLYWSDFFIRVFQVGPALCVSFMHAPHQQQGGVDYAQHWGRVTLFTVQQPPLVDYNLNYSWVRD